MRKITSLIIIGCLFIATVAFTLNVEFAESTSETMFFDDFNDGVADGWTESTGGNGSWSVVDEEYSVSVGLVENGISTVNNLTLSDCIVEVKLRFTDAVGFRAGIIFRYTDNEHYYTFEVSNEYDRVQLFVFTPANPDYGWAPSPPPSYPISKDIEYTLRVEIHSNTFTGYLNGLEMVSLTDGNFTTGQVGLRARRADVFFDNFTVSRQTLITVPDDYPTIQEAINAASEGDTISVLSGTYYEHLVISKTLTLQGENRNTTIIDNQYFFPSAVNVTANNVKFSGFTIQNCTGRALWLDIYGNLTFSHNIITGCDEGVRLHRSSGNVVSENIVQDCRDNTGVGIDYGINNTVHRNIIINNHIGLSGGIDCHGNTFSENTIINNDVGFGTGSYDNKFFHNNFVSNGVHVIASGINQFDDGYPSGGNYWTDYAGADISWGQYQNETGGDGIGDEPYIIDSNNRDSYPLMRSYVPFENQTIYVRADGSVDPSGAPIQRRGNTYTLTGNITANANGIVIERSNVIVDGAGYTLQGSGIGGTGFRWSNISNVTIHNSRVQGFAYAIWLGSSSNSTVSGNNMANNSIAIRIDSSNGNSVNGNNITNCDVGLELHYSPGNLISENSITQSPADDGGDPSTRSSGLIFHHSTDNLISGNNITNNGWTGIELQDSNSNTFFGNNIQDNSFSGVYLGGSNNNVSGNNIESNGVNGILISGSNNVVSGNNIKDNDPGICLESASSNIINGNNFTSNWEGVSLYESSDNRISRNTFFNDGIGRLRESFSNVIEDNLVNGKPLVYLEDSSDYIIEDAGQVILVNCSHITVENLNLSHTSVGVELWRTNNTRISGNEIANNVWGIYLTYSSNNSISENNITNSVYGIELELSPYNGIIGNNIENNDNGIWLQTSSNNSINGNTIVNNYYGIFFGESSYNSVYHNNLADNNRHVGNYPISGYVNFWDNGCEGNYWSNYNGSDLDGDGIGDTFLPWEEVDSYPLMNPYWNPADIDHDLDVDIFDVVRYSVAYGSTPSDPNWNPHCDIAEPYGVIDIFDIVTIAGSYGEEYAPWLC